MSSAITPAKRNQLILLSLGTAGACALVWWFVIAPLQASHAARRAFIVEAQEKHDAVTKNMRLADAIQKDHDHTQVSLELAEDTMAQGDIYRWAIRVLRAQAPSHHVELSSFEPPTEVDWSFHPPLRYKMSGVTVAGSAFYHDLGRFIATVENTFPTMRVDRLQVESTRGAAKPSNDDEKLNFRLTWVTLVKPKKQP
jgi:hypothetical protein